MRWNRQDQYRRLNQSISQGFSLGVGWCSLHYVLLREWGWERNWLNDWLDRAKSLKISLPDKLPILFSDKYFSKIWDGASREVSQLSAQFAVWCLLRMFCSLRLPPLLPSPAPRLLTFSLSVSFSRTQPCKPCVCVHAKSLQSCLTVCSPVDYSPPGSSLRLHFKLHLLQETFLNPQRPLPHNHPYRLRSHFFQSSLLSWLIFIGHKLWAFNMHKLI